MCAKNESTGIEWVYVISTFITKKRIFEGDYNVIF